MENNPLLNETKASNPLTEMDYNSLTPENRLTLLASELEDELRNVDKLIGRLSKKQLERVLRRTLNYPLNILKPSNDEAERVVGGSALKIEHLKIMTINLAEKLDNTKGEQNERQQSET